MQPKPHAITSRARFDWIAFLSDPAKKNASCVQVNCLPYSPLADIWKELVSIGLKVEVKNNDCNTINGYWIASVVRISGYYLCLRYEGFGSDSSRDFWMSISDPEIHPVGWCASQRNTLVPPATVEKRYTDWRAFLQNQLTGSSTLPDTFKEQLKESMTSRLKVGMRLEVVDKKRISAVRLAHIEQIIGGRLHIRYTAENDPDDADDFWCHQNSLLIHPIGWAQLIGHELKATEEYANESLNKAVSNSFDEKDAAWTLFPPVKKITPVPNSDPPTFQLGMKLEAIDPLNLSTICVATVVKVLRCDYLMIGIDGMMSEDGSDWFCYHASSPCIFPAGFCQSNGITLSPPINYPKEFNWDAYLDETNSVAAPAELFDREVPDHGIREGDLLEAVDLMEPNLICVATVARVVGRLLRVHFNGWEDTYDQWIDCESPDLFPPGWCAMVGYNLEPPRNSTDQYSILNGEARTRKKTPRSHKLGGNKRRKVLQRTRDSYGASESSSHDYMDEDDSNSVLTPERPAVAQESTEQLTPRPQSQATPPPLPSDPNKWNVLDVENFLSRNNYASFAPAFVQKQIDGPKLFKLTDKDITELTGCKVGPALKINALIQTLRK